MEFSKTTFQKCGNMVGLIYICCWFPNEIKIELCKQEIRMDKPKIGPTDALDVHSWLLFVFDVLWHCLDNLKQYQTIGDKILKTSMT